MTWIGQQPYKDQLKALVLEDLATIHIIDVNYLATRFNEIWCTNGHDRDGNLFNIVGANRSPIYLFKPLFIHHMVSPSTTLIDSYR